MNPIKKISVAIFTAAFMQMSLYAQITINGPVCVKAGSEYRYIVQSTKALNPKTKVCVTGGTIAGSKNSCVTGDTNVVVSVVWNDKTTKGAISFSSPGESTSLDISICDDLNPGAINVSKTQKIAFNSKPAAIICTPASGGNCSPSYQYQWQWSDNDLYWTDIDGATSQNLSITALLKLPVFYRRRVTETLSGAVAYSESAAVYVDPETK